MLNWINFRLFSSIWKSCSHQLVRSPWAPFRNKFFSVAFPECRPRRRHRYIQPEPRANNVVKNEADNSKNNSSAAAEEKQEGNEKSGRKNSSSDLDSDSRAALKLMMCCLHWRYCSFYGFHFLRSMLRLARQAKTSLFSQAQTPHPLLDPHPHLFRNIWVARRQSVLVSEIPSAVWLVCPVCVAAGCTWSPKVKLGKISIKKHLSNPQLMPGLLQRSFHPASSSSEDKGMSRLGWSSASSGIHSVGLLELRSLPGHCNFPRIR